jgi:DNA-binding CsgD family transcriptional regulator
MTTITRSTLTTLEQGTLELVANGLTFEQIGRQVGISAHAAELRMWRAKQKLGGTTTPHAILLACRAGLLDGRPRRHGDHAGYMAHRRRGEDPCEACRDGERAHRAGRKEAAA